MNGRDWLIKTESDLLGRFDRLFIARVVSDMEAEEIVGFDDDGNAIANRFPLDTMSDFRGLLLPRGVLTAIAEHVKPGPSQGEIARLEEALKVERGRVDSLLARVEVVRP